MASMAPGKDRSFFAFHAFLVLLFVPTVLGFVVAGPDAGKAPPLEAAAVKKKKKSKKGVYRPKIQIDVVFKRSTPPPVKKAVTQPKKRYTRKKKAGKDGLALGGEDSAVVGVAGGDDDGAGGSCMEGVVLAGERSVLLPEIGVGIGVEVEREVEEERVEVKKKVGEEGIEMVKDVDVGMEEDGTPPPKPAAMERRLTRTYLRRNGLNAKRCLDFGLGKSDDQVLPVAEGEVIAVAEARVGEVIVEDEKETVASSMRKPRTKRATGLVKLDYANPGEWISLLTKNKSFNKSGGRGRGEM